MAGDETFETVVIYDNKSQNGNNNGNSDQLDTCRPSTHKPRPQVNSTISCEEYVWYWTILATCAMIALFATGGSHLTNANRYSASKLNHLENVTYPMCETNPCMVASVTYSNDTCSTINSIMLTKTGKLLEEACSNLCAGRPTDQCAFAMRQDCFESCVSRWADLNQMIFYHDSYAYNYKEGVILVSCGSFFALTCLSGCCYMLYACLVPKKPVRAT